VRAIFTLYLEHGSVDQVLAAVQAQSWRNKHWTVETDTPRPGRPFSKASLERLLSSVLYIGQVRHEGKTYPGEQASIIEEPVWREAQKLLSHGRSRRLSRRFGTRTRTAPGATAQHAERVPRVARLMALALRFEQMIRQAVVPDYAVLAAVGRVSRARVTQIMNLLNLAPDIQEQILFLTSEVAEHFRICEQTIRRMSSLLLWSDQRTRWAALTSKISDRL